MTPVPFPSVCPKLSVLLKTQAASTSCCLRFTRNHLYQHAMDSFSPLEHPTSIQSLSSNLSDGITLSQVKNDEHSTKRSHLPSLHHHRPHRHHRHGRDAGQTTSVSSLLKHASRGSPHSPTHNAPESNRSSVVKSEGNGESIVPLPKPVKSEDVARERTHMKMQEGELRSSLQTLHDHSLKASRRLDNTYYTILEKVTVLRQSIEHFQELSSLTKELHETFRADTGDLAEEICGQIDALDNFKPQEDQLVNLESRIVAGREKASVLNSRLSEARKQVEARAKVEAEWEARTRTRRWVLCGILGGVVATIVAAILIQQFRPIPSMHDPRTSILSDTESRLRGRPIPDPVKQALVGQSFANYSPSTATPPILPTSSSDDDPTLRIFDEL